jgi:hypothetical protein
MGVTKSSQGSRWPNRIVPFVIDARDFPAGSANRAVIQAAINHWNSNTVMRLRPRQRERDFVRFVAATSSCSSPIGRQGGAQNIGCDLTRFNRGSIIHEIGHAVGMYHEHVRQDRNRFVTVDLSNIQAGQSHNFKQRNSKAHDVGPYDYGSIMHYGPRAFAQNPRRNTITAPSPWDTMIGQRAGLSSGDVNAVEEAYRLSKERFFGVWRKSSRAETQLYSVSYQEYRARYDALWPQGWRLHLLNVAVIRGRVRYTAVWRRSKRPEIQVYGWKYKDYRDRYDALWSQGWRLHILQPYVVRGQVRYTAVWRKSRRSEIQVYGWKNKDYRAKYDQLWHQGWRLQLLQPYVIQGKVRYTAVWHRSKRPEIQVYGWTYRNYRAKYHQLWRSGWRLHLLQPYRVGSRVRYTAVWHLKPGRGEYQVYNQKYADYRGFYDEKWPGNWRLHRAIVI